MHHNLGCALIAVCLAAGLASAAVTQLDLSNGENYDAYISAAEVTEALSYSPSGDWGLTSRLVGAVFGEHSIYSFSRTPAFQSQTSGVGLPDDGVITKGAWTYQLNTTLDNPPVGGWGNPQIAAPTTPTGLLSMARNVVRAYAIHTGTVDPPTATVTFDFIPSQQGQYSAINMLMMGSSEEFTIYADYSDGQETLWTGYVPFGNGTLDPTTYPSEADLESAYDMTAMWSQGGDYSIVRTDQGDTHAWQFKDDGLALDPDRTLEGLTIHMTPGAWNARSITFLAMSAVPVPEPTTLGLLALGGLALIRRRR